MFIFHKRIQGFEGPRGQVKPTLASEIFYPVKSRSEQHHFTLDRQERAQRISPGQSNKSNKLNQSNRPFHSPFDVGRSMFDVRLFPIAYSL